MLCGDACFVFVESTERNTIPFLFQGEPQVTPLPTAEPRDGSGIADPSLVSEGSATPDEDTRQGMHFFFFFSGLTKYDEHLCLHCFGSLL